MTKKIFAFLLGTFLIGVSFATYQSNEKWLSPEYKTMGFQATLNNDEVSMSWDKFTLPNNHNFVYWKVMRSQNTDSPVYREDKSEYVTYNGDINFTSYTDSSTKKGTTRYRICAITQANDGYHRYCSKEVKKITLTSAIEEKTIKEEPKKEKSTTLTDAQKTVLDQLANDFLKKLNEKYGTDATKRKEILTNVIAQLDILGRKQVKIKAMITYLTSKLETTIDPLDEIKGILKVE